MSARTIRVNALLRREISEVLHRDYRDDAVRITISDVRVSPDLRNADVFYAVLGGTDEICAAKKLFRRISGDIKFKVGKNITLKYLPHFKYQYDDSIAKGMDLVDRIDHITQNSDS